MAQYYVYKKGSDKFRNGIRGGYYVTDIVLTTTGFSGAENTDWKCIDKVLIPLAEPNGAPSGLVLTVISDTEIDGAFTINSTDHDGHKIYMSSNNGVSYSLKNTVPGSTSFFQATGLTVGSTYLFYVVAYKGTTESLTSNIAVETTWSTLDAGLTEYSTDALAQTAFITNDTGIAAWVSKAGKSGTETNIQAMCVFNGKIYGSTYNGGRLLEWNGTDAWVEKAGQLNSETNLTSLVVFNNKIYAGTSPNGNLFEWNGTDAWVQKAPKTGAETNIAYLLVYHNELYGCTNANGLLVKWNGSNAWTTVATKYSGQSSLTCLIVHLDQIFAGTGTSGYLLLWNGVDAWIQEAGQFAAGDNVRGMVVHNNVLYAGVDSGKLLYWNNINAWALAAPKLNSETAINRLVVYNNKIYGGTNTNGMLYEWNGTNAWVERSGKVGAATYIPSLITFNDKIYGGTIDIGNLYEWKLNLICASESTIVNNGTYSLRSVASITDSLNKTLTKTYTVYLNLAAVQKVTFNIRSNRTGSNIKIGLHDTGGTTTETTPNITSANVFQAVTWDLSAVSNADKDTINSIIITVVNADAENTFYIDGFNFYTTNRIPVLSGSNPLIAECAFRSMVIVGSTYHLFEEQPYFPTSWTIHKRTSADGLSFSAQSAALFSYGGAGQYDEKGQADPSVIYDGAGDWKMWYDTLKSVAPDVWFSIGYATSADGDTWSKYGAVLSVGGVGAWDVSFMHHPCVIKYGTTYYMFYAGADNTNYTGMKIGLATSANGINWTKHASNPLIVPGGAGEFDSTNLRPSCPILINGVWYMWYWGYNGTNHYIGLATSSDLVTWVKKGKVLGNPLGVSSEVDPTACMPILSNGIVRLWYTKYTGSWDNITHGALNYATL